MDTIAIEKQARIARAEFLRATVAKLRAAWNEWAERREAAAYLARLSDYELADIGLSRSDIPAAVAGRLFTDEANAHFVNAGSLAAANDDRRKQQARAA